MNKNKEKRFLLKKIKYFKTLFIKIYKNSKISKTPKTLWGIILKSNYDNKNYFEKGRARLEGPFIWLNIININKF